MTFNERKATRNLIVWDRLEREREYERGGEGEREEDRERKREIKK